MKRNSINIPQFLIAAPHSGSGKTLFTLALLRHLHRSGVKVQPFKCGPDYLDTKLHQIAAGELCYNLDIFMSSAEGMKRTYASALKGAGAGVAEGVMGMFDGYDRTKGSSAEVAKTLGIPVVLIVNAKAMAHTVAPLLKGFTTYDTDVRIAGVVFNFVGSQGHYELLKKAAEEVGVEPLGWVAPDSSLTIKSRHLGLVTENIDDLDAICDAAADRILLNVDVKRLLELTSLPVPYANEAPQILQKELKVAVARDSAFNFIYPANLDALRREADIVYFSPLEDTELPEADLVYLPGGYPELYAKQLSDNSAMLESVRRYCMNGGRMLAECGGMIYLSKYLRSAEGEVYPLAGIFDFGTTMEGSKCTLGYRRVVANGVELRGHEFHYSRSEGTMPDSVAHVTTGTDRLSQQGVYRVNGCVASYIHLYWGDGTTSIFDYIDAIVSKV